MKFKTLLGYNKLNILEKSIQLRMQKTENRVYFDSKRRKVCVSLPLKW